MLGGVRERGRAGWTVKSEGGRQAGSPKLGGLGDEAAEDANVDAGESAGGDAGVGAKSAGWKADRKSVV